MLNGQWGPYLTANGRNYKIPKGTDASLLTADECLVLIKEGEATSRPVRGGAKTGRAAAKAPKKASTKSATGTPKKVPKKVSKKE